MPDVPDILKRIIQDKELELPETRRRGAELRAKAASVRAPLDFMGALVKDRLCVIAEVKKASPSSGVICADFDPAAVAEGYLRGGADAVSVLTDVKYFQGSADYLSAVRRVMPETPVLRKDFIIDEIQITEARALGADTFLLISGALELSKLRDLLLFGRSLGMEALVESHDEKELEKALSAGSQILGVNNRDLRTFSVDIKTSERLVSMIPDSAVAVSESGIRSAGDAAALRAAGFDAILAGETLMRRGKDRAGEIIRDFQVR